MSVTIGSMRLVGSGVNRVTEVTGESDRRHRTAHPPGAGGALLSL